MVEKTRTVGHNEKVYLDHENTLSLLVVEISLKITQASVYLKNGE